MTIDVSQFYQAFFEETEELLAEMEKLLLATDIAAPDAEDLNAIFRAAHSIKGGASTFGIIDLTETTHTLESLLDRLRRGEMALTSGHVDAFLAAKDVLKMQLDGHRFNKPVDAEAVSGIRLVLETLARETPASMPSAASRSLAAAGGRAAAPMANAVPLAASAAGSGCKMQCFRIEIPTLPQRDADALVSELAMLGAIEAERADAEHTALLLTTGEDADSIMGICSFVLDAAQVRITALPDALSTCGAPANEDQQGYGFFEPLHSIIAADEATRAQEAAQGYGFFAPFVPRGEGEAGSRHTMAEAVEAAEAGEAPEAAASPAEKRAAAGFHGRETERPATATESTSIRVSIEKVDQLINLVGELVITQAMIEQRSNSLDPMAHERLLNSVSQLTRNTRDLQEAVMSIRMMPMDYVFSRFPRMVRDLAAKLGKKVELLTQGAATELDKGLIERIIDPLTHLVRNSIDHGLETPAMRIAAGKNETGRLSLSAAHQGGNIVIEVSDDGNGLSRERILAKARQQGMAVSDSMPDGEVWLLIFEPGFSTAEVVTDVSGRGVGMDVVRRNINALGGVVDIRSSKGFGTTVSVSLPLTLAILDGMSVKVGEEIYILPLGYVIESLRPAPADVRVISGQGRVVKVRGEYLPLLALHQIFGVDPLQTDPCQGIVIILESEGRKAALFVDELVGQQQVVVKNLESNYRKVIGISGATILGDGGVSLIIDVAALLRSTRRVAEDGLVS